MTTTTAPAPKATRKQAEMIDAHLELAHQIEELTEQLEALDKKLVSSIGLGNSIEVEGVARFTVTDQTTYDIDFEALQLARPTWARKVTKKVFDRRKFGLLRNANEVPADILEMVKEKTTAPFLRVTLRQPKS